MQQRVVVVPSTRWKWCWCGANGAGAANGEGDEVDGVEEGGGWNVNGENNRRSIISVLPDDVVLHCVFLFLSCGEVVLGPGATCKWLLKLVRREFGVVVNVFPFQTPNYFSIWNKISGVRYSSSTCGRAGMKPDEMLTGVKRDKKGWYSLSHLDDRFVQLSFSKCSPFSVFDIDVDSFQYRHPRLKDIQVTLIKICASDLLLLRSISTLESLSFKECQFECVLNLFPENLKRLFASFHKKVRIGNLPHSLKSLEIDGSVELEPGFLFPLGLINIEISNLSLEAGNEEDENKSQSLLNSLSQLKSLKIGSALVALPPNLIPLEIDSLNTLELIRCRGLRFVSNCFPQSIRKLRLIWCYELTTVKFPSHLEELECEACHNLGIDSASLPESLKKLRLVSFQKMGETTEIFLSSNLQELYLDGFDKLESLVGNFPSGFHSLTLKRCEIFTHLPTFPQALRYLELYELSSLETIPTLPDELSNFSLSHCAKLKSIDHISPRLRCLRLELPTLLKEKETQMKKATNFNFKLPHTLTELDISSTFDPIDISQYPSHLEILLLKNLKNIESLPLLPETLSSLSLSWISNLGILPALPSGLKSLYLKSCGSIRVFSPLPQRLVSFSLKGCHQVQFVGIENESPAKIGIPGRLPSSLKEISLRLCKKLEKIGDFPRSLRVLIIEHYHKKILLLKSWPENLEESFIFIRQEES